MNNAQLCAGVRPGETGWRLSMRPPVCPPAMGVSVEMWVDHTPDLRYLVRTKVCEMFLNLNIDHRLKVMLQMYWVK